MERLTPREVQILTLVAHGLTYKAIGQQLGVTSMTAKTQGYIILQKLEAHSQAQAVYLYFGGSNADANSSVPGDCPCRGCCHFRGSKEV